MAPFRASRSTRSGRPGGPTDADIFEGLPVRQWKLRESLLQPPNELKSEAAKFAATQNDKLDPPMPKGSESYSTWSQALLRVARSGKVLKLRNGAKVEKRDTNVGDQRVDEVPKGTKRAAQDGFLATKWSQVPKHLEEPEPEFLAKRRKGLQSTTALWAVNIDTTNMRKTKVRREDEEGQPQVLEVMIPEGQTVEGEIKEEAALDDASAPISAPAPGTIVHGLGIANEDGVVVATEGVMPLKRTRPSRKKKKKKKKPKGTNATYSTGGLGVSASAEAFDEQQRIAQMAAESGKVTEERARDDVRTTGTNRGDEEEEEGSDEEEEGEEEEGEGDTTILEKGKLSDPPEAADEVPGVAPEPGNHVTAEPEAKLQEPEVEKPQTEDQAEVPMATEEETPNAVNDDMGEQVEKEQEQSTVEPQAEMEVHADDMMEIEMHDTMKIDDKEDVKKETVEEEKEEPQTGSTPQLDPKDEVLYDAARQDRPPGPPDEDVPSTEESLRNEPFNEPAPESVEDAVQPEETEELKGDGSIHTPPRPSPEPLSPFSLSPNVKGRGPQAPAPIPTPLQNEESTAAQETPLSELSRPPSTVQSTSVQSPLSPLAGSTPSSNGDPVGREAAQGQSSELRSELPDTNPTRPTAPAGPKEAAQVSYAVSSTSELTDAQDDEQTEAKDSDAHFSDGEVDLIRSVNQRRTTDLN